ncbi:hypothetical protein H2200_006743 [Cladophialophora chaetospira]|uniref:Rax2-like second domain-containing protein n=1 Tax=Cladophialophora chaetospira TaxID=386627 RepID=A0AA38X9D4_9EURO|nr:hypothetical protein H2200_006743 [Cladophialophora chaetospira]
MSNNTLIPLGDASVIAAPPSPNAAYSDPTSVLHNKTWLMADDEPGSWTASFGFAFTPARMRLWNSDVDGTGIKSFSLTPLSTSGLSNLSYVDPAELTRFFCDSQCPLADDPSPGYQDFYFVNLISMNAFRLDISSWYGNSGGFRGIQLFGDFQASTSPSTGTSVSSASSTSTRISTSATAPTSTNSAPPRTDATLSGGAIAGIVIGALAVAATLIAIACFIFWRRKSKRTPQLDEKFIPLGGRHEVEANGTSPAKCREELDSHVVSELDVTPARQELDAAAVHEVPGDTSLK